MTQRWVNNPDFKDPESGYDLIIGQNNAPGAERERRFTISFMRDGVEQREVIATRADWVIPTGGGYFFAPSIEALEQLAGYAWRAPRPSRSILGSRPQTMILMVHGPDAYGSIGARYRHNTRFTSRPDRVTSTSRSSPRTRRQQQYLPFDATR